VTPSPDPHPGGDSGWRRLELGSAGRVPILDEEALGRIEAQFEDAEARGIRAILLTGGGGEVFAAGADLRRLRGLDPPAALRFARYGQYVFDRVASFPGVVIVVVNGRCIGGAFDLVLACDIRLGGPRARFEHPGPRLGFITGYGGTDRLTRACPGAAAAVLAGARALDARAALSLGLLAKIHGVDELDAQAESLAFRVSRAATDRTRRIKDIIRGRGFPGGWSPGARGA